MNIEDLEFFENINFLFALEQFSKPASKSTSTQLYKFSKIYYPIINYEYITIDPYLINLNTTEIEELKTRIDILLLLQNNIDYNPTIDINKFLTKCISIFLEDISEENIFLRSQHTLGEVITVLFKNTLKYSSILIQQPKKIINMLTHVYELSDIKEISPHIKNELDTHIIDISTKKEIDTNIVSILKNFNFTPTPIFIGAVTNIL